MPRGLLRRLPYWCIALKLPSLWPPRLQGFPKLRADGSTVGNGDQYVHLRVAVPRSLTPKQRALYLQVPLPL